MEFLNLLTLDQTRYRTILGVPFFFGTAAEAVDRMRDGGLLVVPSAPALKDLQTNLGYRSAVLNADLVITDSAYMVLIWNRMMRDHIKRLSGLEYLIELLRRPYVREPGNTLWIMAGRRSADRNLAWLVRQGITVPEDCIYIAPMYGNPIEDHALIARLERLRPRHVVVTVGGGTQEPLGHYLKQHLTFLPGIHCIGAAIAFLSGDQVGIPMWADRLYLGWLFRIVWRPRQYGKRYWDARKLWGLMRKYRQNLPELLR